MQVFLTLLAGLVLYSVKDTFALHSIKCGIQKIKTRELITRGYDTYPGQFPWHVALYHKTSKTVTEYACGGSLISHSFVLTAAHCTKSEDSHEINPKRLIVAMGLYNRQLFGPTAQQHSVYLIHTAPLEGQWAELRNDIALLELSSSVKYTDYIQPICLNTLDVASSNSGMIVGWGKTENGDLPDILKTAPMPIISHIDCLVSDRAFHGGILDSGMICAGHQNGTSVCNGDSGGGLIVKRCSFKDCFWYVVGIVSSAAGNADGSCRSDGYGAFTNVQKYLPWIKQTTELDFEGDSLDDVCGQRQDGSARAKWPWLGTMYRSDQTGFDVERGIDKFEAFAVFILTKQFVITTAQNYEYYIDAPAIVKVRFGLRGIGISDGWTQDTFIQEAFLCPEDVDKFQRLALFKLRNELHFTKYVQPICLWQADSSLDMTANQFGFMVSFGDFNRGDQLQENAMSIVSEAKCGTASNRVNDNFRDEHIICALAKNETGLGRLNIGNGLVIRSGSSWFLRGLLFKRKFEFSFASNIVMHYALFFDVTLFSQWVITTIENESDSLKKLLEAVFRNPDEI